MRLTKLELTRILIFLFVFPVMLLTFNIVIGFTGAIKGFWIALIIYWLLILSLAVGFIGISGIIQLYKLKKSKSLLWGLLAFIPVIGTFFVSFLPSFHHLNNQFVILVLTAGFLNGICEELFWRGMTLGTEIRNRSVVILASLLGFGACHIPLALVKGLHYQGGVLALIGGAVVMGILWQFVAIRTKSIVFVTIAHILVNVFAFSTLVLHNWQE
jgi:membrane protease YdiL (CAAX protease family)